MKGFPDLPPIWFAGFCILAWILAQTMPFMVVPGAEIRLLGMILVVLGLAIVLWAALWFRKKGTTIEPHHDPEVLITEGPFRFSRNPIYLAMVVMLMGFVLWLGALSPIILPGIFISILSLRFIMPEEERLIATFGAEARQYMEATRRWL